MPIRSLVAVVDDDESVREALPDLLRELGFAATSFASAEALLAFDALSTIECLILDISMPEMSGPDLFDELRRRGAEIPVVFITANAEPAVRARLLKAGAVACLFKPCDDLELRNSVNAALRRA
jgi:FixJ family two-component response regulator